MSNVSARRDAIVQAWRTVLESDPASDDENFFDAGGNSILLVVLQRELSKRLGFRVPLRMISGAPTVSGLMGLEGATGGNSETATPFPPPQDEPAPLAHSQERLWLAEQFNPGHADGTIEHTYLLSGDLDPTRLESALLRVIEHHAVLRTVYPIDEVSLEPTQVTRPTAALTLEQRPAANVSGAEDLETLAARLISDWWETPFDLEADPPVRARLCALDEGRHMLCLQMHHLAFDGWSEKLLIEDLATAYAGGDLQAPPVSYESYSRWERAETERWRENDIPFWREHLSQAPPPFLPAPPDSAQAARREESFDLDRESVGRLIGAAARHSGPPGAALLAAAGRAMSGVFGVPDLCLGTVTAGRVATALEPVIGCFINPLALVLQGVSEQTAGELLSSSAEVLTSAMEHGRTPFNEVVRLLGPDRSRHPWFQAWVVLQNDPPRAVLDDTVVLEAVRVPQPRSSLDLLVEAIPRPDGGWRVYLAWRADCIDEVTGMTLLKGLRTAFTDMAALA
ncbi:condensation domain-containing protein [Streptomyces sp. NPDC058534]|uniref:condensation domain-containing protein n=1 Tax=Streptomyces sp. NPDC058534 TaxID=3346541 RepID=UPI00365CC407